MFALPINMEASFFQRFDGAQMIYSGKPRHQLRRKDFHLANFTARFGFSIKIYVTANRIFDVCKRIFNICALRMTSRQFRTTNRYTFVVPKQRYVKFPFHHASVPFAPRASTVGLRSKVGIGFRCGLATASKLWTLRQRERTTDSPITLEIDLSVR